MAAELCSSFHSRLYHVGSWTSILCKWSRKNVDYVRACGKSRTLSLKSTYLCFRWEANGGLDTHKCFQEICLDFNFEIQKSAKQFCTTAIPAPTSSLNCLGLCEFPAALSMYFYLQSYDFEQLILELTTVRYFFFKRALFHTVNTKT